MKWLSWLKIGRRKPAPKVSFTACPQCGKEMVRVEKNTISGDDIRTYRCNHCNTEHDFNFGRALWKVMSDANRQDSSK